MPPFFNGLEVSINDNIHRPKIRIRDDMLWCTDDVRREVNDYLLATFGASGCAAYEMQGRLVMCSCMYRKVSNEIERAKGGGS